jgi:hypothetical protein
LLLYHTHLSLFFTIDALVTTNARISSLEAKLESSKKAFDAATTAKTSAEKSSKSALDKVKKMEKSLADLKKERIQQDQTMALRLNKMSALAGGKYLFSLLCLSCLFLYSTDVSLFPRLYRTYQDSFDFCATRRQLSYGYG